MTDLNEAPVSVTYSVTSPKGFPALVTIRDDNYKSMATKMEFMDDWFTTNGYKPQIRQSFGAKKEIEYVPGKLCPKDGGRLIKKISKAGKEYHACENGKYNFTSKTTLGCDYVDWLTLEEF